jgi:nucleotide-binding universal stress UspA family protein
MSYESILVHVQTSPEAQPRLSVARVMAERFDAVLIGVGVEMVPALAAGTGAGAVQADWYAAVSVSIEENLKVAERMFWEAAAGLAKGAVWEQGLAFPKEALAAASRGADLVVAGRGPKNHKSDYRDAGAAELAVALGRPLLVTPDKAPSLSASRVVLAWKDTREARRAMSDALPFLKGAEGVVVLEVCHAYEEPDARLRVDDVVIALKRHGVAAEARVMVHSGPPALEIIRLANLIGADLIVAGAYGHARLGEWLFGGVTQDLLEQGEHYVLLSH